uniref:LIM homeobox transcription factor 1, alpha n=1 Tax=Esox lucius TaxID=8010 RepID=A0A3P8Y3K5_ESOLU
MSNVFFFSGVDMTQSVVCAGCYRLIRDKYLLRVNGGLWHEQCVRCAACCDPLRNTCFLRDQKLYCKRDYARLFSVRCRGCVEAISPAELVMRAGAEVFHLACFSCSVCSCRLQTGDCFVFREGRLLCARDLDLEVDTCTSSDSGKSDEEKEEEASVKASGRHSSEAVVAEHKQPKRPRTILSTQQRRAFKASFEVSSKPCRKVRETLATETGLSVRVVQVWFQNQRAKMKKLARRQQQLQRQQQPPTQVPHQQQEGQVTTLQQQDQDMEPFRQGLTPPRMPGDHMHPYGYKALYMEMDGDPLYHLYDGTSLSYGDSSLLTPIDCLYSMQDSYFTS